MASVDLRMLLKSVSSIYGLLAASYVVVRIVLERGWVRKVARQTTPKAKVVARLASGIPEIVGFSLTATGFSLMMTTVATYDHLLAESDVSRLFGLGTTVIYLVLLAVFLLALQCLVARAAFQKWFTARSRCIECLPRKSRPAYARLLSDLTSRRTAAWQWLASLVIGLVSVSTPLFVLFGSFLRSGGV